MSKSFVSAKRPSSLKLPLEALRVTAPAAVRVTSSLRAGALIAPTAPTAPKLPPSPAPPAPPITIGWTPGGVTAGDDWGAST